MIKTHVELAKVIEGKTILHLNSLGKDSVICLHWLTHFAKPKRVHSLFMKRFTTHPDEDKYWRYLTNRYYGKAEFHIVDDPNELNAIIDGQFQPPNRIWDFNSYEYSGFSKEKLLNEIVAGLGTDYICDGTAGYEGMGRASKFHNKGLLQGKYIYPLGLMKKKSVTDLIGKLDLQINPTYRHYSSTFDEINYFRMRSAIRRSPQYREKLFKFFPLLRLDQYRWEHLING